jgi:molybdopterin synthase catalytic subunit
MVVQVQLTQEPLGPSSADLVGMAGSAGAWVEFSGTVRADEEGRPIDALEYEAYEPMAIRQMERILRELAVTHLCLAVSVVHRLGRIPAGEHVIRVRAAAAHRQEAFALVAQFMDRLKQDVPIWKRRVVLADTAAAATPSGIAPKQSAHPLRTTNAGQ